MPELPEVETTRRGIEPYLLNQKVLGIEVRQAKLRWPIPVAEIKTLEQQTVQSVTRRGKYLLINTSAGSAIIHLGMSGCLRVVENNKAPAKHDHVDFLFEKHALRLTDPRRFGAVLWSPASSPLSHPLLIALGPEPFCDSFNGEYLFQKLRTRKLAIKQVIMDSKVVVGVGNIYASEALFLAGIDPQKPANKISKERICELVTCIRETLKKAILKGGTTLKDFYGADGKPGYFRHELNVYGRTGMSCVKCKGIIKEIRQGQRATFYCSRCQR